jgi:predicted dehydrogenase
MTLPENSPAGAGADRLRVGVVGTGYLGKFHARIYNDMPDVDLVGIVDVNEAAAKAVAEECGCPAYTESESLLDKVDAVSIVVPTELHLEVARPFLEKKIHMLLEKPVAPSYEEALKLVELAENSDVIFQVGHLERYNAGVMALAERVTAPRFIEVHRLGPFVARATDVDVVTDLMIHDIDIVMELVGSPIKTLSAMGSPVITNHVDIANARIEFENGAVANVTASRVSNKKFRRIRVFEHEHYYGLDYTDQCLDIATARRKNKDDEWPEIVTERLEVEPILPLNAELEDFINNIRSGDTPLVTGRVGLEALRVALLVKEKMAACLPL